MCNNYRMNHFYSKYVMLHSTGGVTTIITYKTNEYILRLTQKQKLISGNILSSIHHLQIHHPLPQSLPQDNCLPKINKKNTNMVVGFITYIP